MNNNLSSEKSRTKKIIKIALVASGIIVVCGFLYAGYWYYQYVQLFKALETAISEPRTPIPCNGNPASKIEMGRIYATGTDEPSGKFATIGGDIYFVARGIERSAVLDFGNTAIIKIGKTKQDNQTDLYKMIGPLTINENEYNKITLESGNYSIWTSTGTNIEIVSCTPNGVSLLPQK
ncbi:MAG: hypothetical protein WC878_04655 [Candidatus Paceibacterota bacterium]|jgi:hypothetical protein